MSGSEKVRFCGQCEKNVYNLSGMSRREAEDLIRRSEGRLCVRFYRRADGSVLTDNCPVGLRALKRKISRTATAILSAVLSFFAGVGVFEGLRQVGLAETTVLQGETTMGAVAMPEREHGDPR